MSQRNGSCKSGLSFIHPRTEKERTSESPLPKDFREALKLLRVKNQEGIRETR
jgi:hypothetical protein